jgi:hypothetical protein
MTPTNPTSANPTPAPDPSTQWSSARRLYPIYFELAREFVIDVPVCADLEAGVQTPGEEALEQANRWFHDMDERIQVHQLRQFLQTTSLVNQEGLLDLLQHFLTRTEKHDTIRDKIDFLLVQYFSQIAPTGMVDAEVDLAFTADSLQSVLGKVEAKPPVWLNALDRVLETARRSRSLDELLHGGALEQGRKAKTQAGDLFYLPIALVAFARFGYLMRRVFFRLMLGDLNIILDGLTELEEKGIQTIDCRRAQFSAEEPILRLRMICQSWKVMFQAEYSSGQPLRMLVDLRASVDHALGRGKAPEPPAKPEAKAKAAPAVKPAAKPAVKAAVAAKPAAPAVKAAAAAAGAGSTATSKVAPKPAAAVGSGQAGSSNVETKKPKAATPKADVQEFEISAPGEQGWTEGKS